MRDIHMPVSFLKHDKAFETSIPGHLAGILGGPLEAKVGESLNSIFWHRKALVLVVATLSGDYKEIETKDLAAVSNTHLGRIIKQ
jgi:hypothetical protein